VTDHIERRKKPRLAFPFPVRIRGSDAMGRLFETNTVLDNLSADGLYVRLMRRVNPGARMFFLIQFSVNEMAELTTSLLAATGYVCRAESQSEGGWGLGVQLSKHRFM